MRIHLNSVVVIGVFSWILFLSSCGSASHHFYATDEGNLLALREEKDLKVSAGYTPHLNSLPGNNINAQIGYSPINHLGIQSSFFRIRNAFEGIEGIKKNVYQYNFSGAAGAYFFKPAKVVNSLSENDEGEKLKSTVKGKGLLFDIYAGYSRGENNNFFFTETGRIELDFQKFYLQGGVHIFLDKIGASFFLRYAQLDYIKGAASGKLMPAEFQKRELIIENNPFNFLESALKISIGKPTAPIRGYLTIAGLYDFGDVFLEIQPSTMQLGVTADIGQFFSKKKKGN